MRRGALPLLLVLLGPLPAAARGTVALTLAQERHAFYCSGTTLEGGKYALDSENDDYHGDAGLQAILVNATSLAACTDGPAAALAACLGGDVTTETLLCEAYGGNTGPGLYVILPAFDGKATTQNSCATLAAALNRKLNTAGFICRNFTDVNNGITYAYLVADASECDAAVGTLNRDIFGICDFYGTQYLNDQAMADGNGWSSLHCEYASNCSLGRTFQSAALTLVTDRVCGNTCSVCSTGITVTSPCSLTADAVCGNLSVGDQVLIALAVFVALGVVAVLLHRQRDDAKTTERLKHKGLLQERLLEPAHGDLEEATAMTPRMLRAWQNKPADVELDEPMAEGATTTVHNGKFAGLVVAVKAM